MQSVVSVRLFPLELLNQQTFDLAILHYIGHSHRNEPGIDIQGHS